MEHREQSRGAHSRIPNVVGLAAKVKLEEAGEGEPEDEKKLGGGGAASLDAGMEPSPPSPSSFISDPTPFRAATWPVFSAPRRAVYPSASSTSSSSASSLDLLALGHPRSSLAFVIIWKSFVLPGSRFEPSKESVTYKRDASSAFRDSRSDTSLASWICE
ncbi:hypothetical protein KM043_006941 [Ampulex compressa]|nr:hypothetical protein KM043_006941 [Ampulex compressa]